MSGNLSTAREALMAELLQDADALVRRFEQADQVLSGKIERATTDAAGKAFLAAKLDLESVIEHNSNKLREAGRVAAAQIGHQLNSGAAQLVAVNAELQCKARHLAMLLAVLALAAAIIGGFIGAKLATGM
ncbi:MULTISPECIES: hypothetical protein [unclassified Caballeronia]|uniref:hypothetical protein n=1 Tax=unclassified Caballeronia TaxID=2646786 RepID=UPI0020296BA8|nr:MULTISPECIES: hypothetical protein [unclassified Caballeronia]